MELDLGMKQMDQALLKPTIKTLKWLQMRITVLKRSLQVGKKNLETTDHVYPLFLVEEMLLNALEQDILT